MGNEAPGFLEWFGGEKLKPFHDVSGAELPVSRQHRCMALQATARLGPLGRSRCFVLIAQGIGMTPFFAVVD